MHKLKGWESMSRHTKRGIECVTRIGNKKWVTIHDWDWHNKWSDVPKGLTGCNTTNDAILVANDDRKSVYRSQRILKITQERMG